jgi:hypothetical protein
MGGRKSDLCLLEMRLTASIFFRDIRKINFVGDASNQAIVQKTFSAGTTPTNEFCKPRLRLQYSNVITGAETSVILCMMESHCSLVSSSKSMR